MFAVSHVQFFLILYGYAKKIPDTLFTVTYRLSETFTNKSKNSFVDCFIF